MRKLIIGLAFLAACSSGSAGTSTAVRPAPSSGGSTTGAASPREAVQMFMTAVKDSNLQAMSVVWGDKDALARDRYSADELFQRETVLVCYLANDSYRILSDAQTMDGGRVVTVEVKRRNLTRSADFNVVQGHSGRWYVFSIPNIQGLQDLCAKRPG